MSKALFFVLYIIYYITLCSTNALSCKSDSGLDTSFWIALKEPSGTGYIYYDDSTPFSFSSHSMNDTTEGALAQTLSQIWSNDGVNTVQYIMYNDENPSVPDTDDTNGYNFTVGHTKAVWAFDTDGGFILQHSIPGFPLGPMYSDTYTGLPGSAWTYGQSIACMNFELPAITSIAGLATLMIPNIYDSRVTESAPSSIQRLVAGDILRMPVCNQTAISLLGNRDSGHDSGGTDNIIFFAKSAEWNNELWAECVAPFFESDLVVESWIHGEAVGPSCTGKYQTLDITELSYPTIGSFSEYYDHSKWAIASEGEENGLVCFGDINRMTSQFLRGGGAFCFFDTTLWQSLHQSVLDTNNCV